MKERLLMQHSRRRGKQEELTCPANRYCDKQTSLRIFTETNDLAKEFFRVNASKDLRRYFIFRMDSKGVRTIKDAYQQGLLLVAHRMRHIDQLKRIMADPKFPR